MKELSELGFSLVVIANKIAVVGIAMFAVWVLQEVTTDERLARKYPVVDGVAFRVSVLLVGTGFALDAFSFYTPTPSEVIMNLGIFLILVLFRNGYKKANGSNSGTP